MNIGYYPIKESEIKQIIKMSYNYLKKDLAPINEILDKYNVNETKRESIYKSIEECLKNKNAQYFNKSFGLCIAKVQKMYRGNFIFKDKSLSELMYMYPSLSSYSTNMEEFLRFKNNRFKFLSKLESENSSGVYISYENVKRLYNDYYTDIYVRTSINRYYEDLNTDIEENKFIQVLDYCIKNKCGLLEANVTNTEIIKPQVQNTNNIETHNRKPVSIANIGGKIIGVRLLLWLALMASNLLLGVGAAYLMTNLTASDIIQDIIDSFEYSAYGAVIVREAITLLISVISVPIIYIPLQIIFYNILWNKYIKSSFKYETVVEEKLSKFITIMAVFLAIITVVNILINFNSARDTLETMDNLNITKYLNKAEENGISNILLVSKILEIISLISVTLTEIIINIKTFINIRNLTKD